MLSWNWKKSDYRINIRKQVAAALANYNYNNASSELVIKNSTLPAAPAAAETSVYDAQAKIGTEGDFIEVVSPTECFLGRRGDSK